MSSHRLLRRRARRIAAWNLTPSQIKALRPAAVARPRRRPRRALPTPIRRTEMALWKENKAFHNRYWRQPELFIKSIFCLRRVKYRVRKNQKNLSATEWERFICAIETLAAAGIPAPTYNDYVDIHSVNFSNHSSGFHMHGAGGNFLAWHREYLASLEQRLRMINPLVTIPYWNWVIDRYIPPQLSNPADITAWGITRGASFNASALPDQSWLNTVMNTGVSPADFMSFQNTLEGMHNVPNDGPTQ